MDYIKVFWFTAEADEPYLCLHELDVERFVTRRIEVTKLGKIERIVTENGFYGDAIEMVSTPTIEEINQDPEFNGTTISREEFEQIWNHNPKDTSFFQQLITSQP